MRRSLPPSVRHVLMAGALLLAWPAAAMASATVTTKPATNVTSFASFLNGAVDPNGTPTVVRFQYGATTSYGGATAWANVGSGGSVIAVSQVVASLQPGTRYHFRAESKNAYNNKGLIKGNDVAFTTPVAADTTAPSVPVGLSVSGQTASSLGLSWSASTDNVGVAGYDVYLNGSKLGTTASTKYTFSGLGCGTAYTLSVAAYDAAGNVSSQASSLASTAACATTPTTLFGSQGGPYSEGTWPGGGWAPYASTSPWNTMLPDYSSAVLDPGSGTEISWMAANWSGNFTPWTVSNNPANDTSSIWGHPVYWAKSSDPTYTIDDTGYACSAGSAATSCPTTVQIPNGAWHATGSDAHMSVIQPDGHTEVDMWQVQNANPISGGGTITVHDYGALDLDGSGCCGGSTAANQGLPAGAIRGPELTAGVIDHALSAVAKCTNGSYVPPATGGALGGCSGAPADGARLQLKMSDATIAGLNVPAYQKTILEAMAHYGVFITDTGGSPMDLQYDPSVEYSAFGNTAGTVMSYLATQGYSDPATIDIALPWSDFQVVSSCYASGTC